MAQPESAIRTGPLGARKVVWAYAAQGQRWRTRMMGAWLWSVDLEWSQPSGLPPMAVYKDRSEEERLLVTTTTARFLVYDWLVFLEENFIAGRNDYRWVRRTNAWMDGRLPLENSTAVTPMEIDALLYQGLSTLNKDLTERGWGHWTFRSWVWWNGREDMLHLILTGLSDAIDENATPELPEVHWHRLAIWQHIMEGITDWRRNSRAVKWKGSATKAWTQAEGSLEPSRRETRMSWVEKLNKLAYWVKMEDDVFKGGILKAYGLEPTELQESDESAISDLFGELVELTLESLERDEEQPDDQKEVDKQDLEQAQVQAEEDEQEEKRDAGHDVEHDDGHDNHRYVKQDELQYADSISSLAI
ncbi:hypothetical protein OQA88_2222 [Cercophora sp. LCS_1]